jgi:hypothetical protein
MQRYEVRGTALGKAIERYLFMISTMGWGVPAGIVGLMFNSTTSRTTCQRNTKRQEMMNGGRGGMKIINVIIKSEAIYYFHPRSSPFPSPSFPFSIPHPLSPIPYSSFPIPNPLYPIFYSQFNSLFPLSRTWMGLV